MKRVLGLWNECSYCLATSEKEKESWVLSRGGKVEGWFEISHTTRLDIGAIRFSSCYHWLRPPHRIGVLSSVPILSRSDNLIFFFPFRESRGIG